MRIQFEALIRKMIVFARFSSLNFTDEIFFFHCGLKSYIFSDN